MKRSSLPPRRETNSPGSVRILRLVAMLAVIGFLLYTSWQQGRQANNAPQPLPPAEGQPVRIEILEEPPAEKGQEADPTKEIPAVSANSESKSNDEASSTALPERSSPKASKSERPEESENSVRTEIKGAVIRNQDGRVIFRGTVDLSETLARIKRGEQDSHPNDGSIFQNREKRLPKQPSGYYREWVHPTPGQRGPGPQRVVTGKKGEIYYTPDHYETFERLDAGGSGS
jgi:guanyl-specific ribonuclease Sa